MNIIVMIAAPDDSHEEYLRILAKITHTLKNEDTRKSIIESKDTKSVIGLFSQMEY